MFSILRKLIKKDKTGKNTFANTFTKTFAETFAETKKPAQNGKPQHNKEEKKHPATIKPERKKMPAKKKPSVKKKKKKQVNRHGIPILQKDADFTEFFKEDKKNRPEKKKKVKAQSNDIGIKKKTRKKTQKTQKSHGVNKHGLRIFSDNTDLYELFGHEPDHETQRSDPKKSMPENRENSHNENNFAALIEKTLKNKSTQELLKEKQGSITGKKHISKNEILKNYPLPQEELDLHGYTGAEAVRETENFIQKARYKGKRTVIIIVGKGTRSPGKPVLPDVVEAKLVELKRKNQVFAFKWEKKIKKKSGAIIVYLKNPTR